MFKQEYNEWRPFVVVVGSLNLWGGLETKDGPGRSAVRVDREVRVTDQIRLAIRRRRQGKVYPGCQGSVWLDRPDGNRSQLKGSNGSISQWCGTLLITRGKPGQAQIAKSTYHVIRTECGLPGRQQTMSFLLRTPVSFVP